MTEHPIHRAQDSRFAAGAIVLITLVTFSAVLWNDFVAWDDPQTITENPALNPPTLANIAHFWNPREPIAGLYVPLTYTTWAAIAAIARDSAGTLHAWPFHLVSLIVHCVAALCVFRILKRLNAPALPSFFGAMFFAIHPLQVESIAWASGLKDALAGCLALLAIEQFLQRRRIIVSTILFALAMLAKPSAASAIFIAIILDVLVLRREIARSLRGVALWIVIAIPLLVIARIAQVTDTVPYVPIWQRPLVALDAFGTYVLMLILPVSLTIDHGRTPQELMSGFFELVSPRMVAAIAALSLGIIWPFSRRARAAWLIMLAGLMWNLGLVPFQFQIHSTVADHYIYLAMLGPAIIVAHFMTEPISRRFYTGMTIVLIVLAGLSVRQILFWRSSDTLFAHAIDLNSRSIATHENLGRLLGQRGDLDGAAKHFEAILAIQSDHVISLRSLALVESRRGNMNQAINHLARAIQLLEGRAQDVSSDRRELVRWLAQQQRWPEVIEQLERARAKDPMNADIARLLQEARQRVATTTTSPSNE